MNKLRLKIITNECYYNLLPTNEWYYNLLPMRQKKGGEKLCKKWMDGWMGAKFWPNEFFVGSSLVMQKPTCMYMCY